MSPEQVEAVDVDHRADLYSLGLIVYEMFTADIPFRGESAMQLMYQRVTAPAQGSADHLPGDAGLPRQHHSEVPGERPGQTLSERSRNPERSRRAERPVPLQPLLDRRNGRRGAHRARA